MVQVSLLSASLDLQALAPAASRLETAGLIYVILPLPMCALIYVDRHHQAHSPLTQQVGQRAISWAAESLSYSPAAAVGLRHQQTLHQAVQVHVSMERLLLTSRGVRGRWLGTVCCQDSRGCPSAVSTAQQGKLAWDGLWETRGGQHSMGLRLATSMACSWAMGVCLHS
jgi:hypothetical protein